MYRKSRISFFLVMVTFLLVAFSYSKTWADGEPYFCWCNVQAMNTPGGVQNALAAQVFDSNGTVPDTINALTVAGPGGFAYSFTPDDYDEGFNVYWHGIPGQPADGEYTFTVTDNEGKVSTSHSYLEVGNILPLPDAASLQASGDPLTPTLSWGALIGYEGNVFYRARIYDMDNDILWTSGFTTLTHTGVPSDVLAEGESYQWRVEAFDDHNYLVSDNRAVSETIPLVIDNNRPYFRWVVAYSGANQDGFYTGLLASVVDPNGSPPDSISEVTVAGPGGFFYTFLPEELGQYGDELIYEHHSDGRPLDGIYTFTLTDNEARTAVSHDYVKVHDVPLVEAASLAASGDPLAPTLSWGAPAGMDRSLYYQVYIESIWRSPHTPDTTLQVPQGILQQGVAYRWRVRALDDINWVHYSNRSNSNGVDLVIDDSRPYFRWAGVWKRNDPWGIRTAMDASVYDPNGSVPESIVSLTVTDPGGGSHDLRSGWFGGEYNEFYITAPGPPAEGVYTFDMEDNEGKTARTHDYVETVTEVPIVDESGILVTGDPMAPTVSWGAISGYPGHLYYRLRVYDYQWNQIYRSSRAPDTAQSVPQEVIEPGKFYIFRIEAADHRHFPTFNSRSRTHYLPLTDCQEDDSGALDIPGASGGSAGTVTIPVRIQNAPNAVDSLGLEVLFDPSRFGYTGFSRGPLVDGFDFFDVSNPGDGIARMGGFEAGEDIIAAGASGDLVYLNFEIFDSEPGKSYGFGLQELKDDLAGWSTSHGCFQSGCDGDVNGDGEITPLDALCAFEAYLSIDPTSCGIPIDEVCGDVNGDGETTPADALCIFQKYLGIPSCLD